jgi:transposase
VNKDEIIAQKDALIAAQAVQIAELKLLFEAALLRISELEAQLNSNSKNSHKPPSSDWPIKKPAFPRLKGAKRGGKPGHKGNTLKMVDSEAADKHVLHGVKEVNCSCGYCLAGVQEEALSGRRQVFDLPPNRLEVTEHRIGLKRCPACSKQYKGVFPQEVNAPVQYGQRVRTLMGLLNVEHGLPIWRIKGLFADLYGYAVNENTVQTAVEGLFEVTKADEALIRTALEKQSLAHFDESGVRVQGALHWVHTASSNDFTYYFVHPKRGKEALGSTQSILPHFKGRAIHDFWASYFQFDCSHGICVAHILRELTALAEHQGRKWALKMHDLFLYMYQFSDNGRRTAPDKVQNACLAQYYRILQMADVEEPPPDHSKGRRPKKSKGRNLMERLLRHTDEVLAFACVDEVPFTNNLAERDIRPWKTKLKVCTSFRTIQGANQFARLKGFCSTAKKQGFNLFEQLCAVQNGHSFLRPLALT